MNSFLSRVAEAYFKHYQDDISRFVFVFPNQRAGMFFQNALAKLIRKPLFSPEIITVDACFKRFTSLQSADRTDLLFRLYKHFIQLSSQEDTFDSFVFWGDMLINDFNEIDKYLANADQLFSNIADIKDIDSTYSYLSENQRNIIENFWNTVINSANRPTSQNFKSLWNVLADLYNNFKSDLRKDQLGYEGMINRDAIYNLRSDFNALSDHFVFIGFNALNTCERELFKILKQRNLADFYWDYESYFLQDPENIASRFKNSNLLNFPSKFDLKKGETPLKNKNFTLYTVPSSVGQAKIIYSILNEINPKAESDSLLNTAVVLSDESLLVPVIQSIPETVGKINVTMGYPLASSSIAAFIELFFTLNKKVKFRNGTFKFYHKDVINLLNHPVLVNIDKIQSQKIQKTIVEKNLIYLDSRIFEESPFYSLLFTYHSDHLNFLDSLLTILKLIQQKIIASSKAENDKVSLDSTFLFQYYTTINRLKSILMDNTEIPISKVDTIILLLKQLTSSISVPFIGEPLQGLQIMGILETRGIDFENIIISSFNDGIYPAKSNTNSFIPYSIRKGFGLPTYEHNDSVTAYNFYNLISRAQNIFFISDTRSENGNSSEISRFYTQLKYLYNIEIKQQSITQNFRISDPSSIHISKNEEIVQKLKLYTIAYPNGKSFSASGLNTYIDCPLKFYYQNIVGMREEEELNELIEHDVFGTIFHKSMEILYHTFVNRIVDSEALDSILKQNNQIDQAILKAFNLEYFKNSTEELIQLEGNNLLISSILKKYISQLIRRDKKITPFKLISMEEKIPAQINTRYGLVNLYGVVDRVHEKNESITVLDYKTGSGSLEIKEFADAFNPNLAKRPKYALQTMLYGYLYKQKAVDKAIIPGIFYVKDAFKDDFNTTLIYKPEKGVLIPIENYHDYATQFEPALIECIENILNPEIPFVQCEDSSHCAYCDFNSICQK